MMKDSLKKIAAMYGASILAIALGFLISIFNSRVLGPEQFGDFKFIETVSRLIASIVSVGFFISITRLLAVSKHKSDEHRFSGIFVVILGIASILGVSLLIGFSYVEPYYFDNNLGPTIRTFFFIVIVILGHSALGEILKGLHQIYSISFISVVPPIFYLLLIYWLDESVTLNTEVVLLCYYGILLIFLLIFLIRLKPNFNYKKYLVQKVLRENKYNGRPIYYGSLAGVATTHIAGLSISYFMDNTQVGFFMLASTICSPLLIIPSVLGTVFFKQFATIQIIPKKVFYFSLLSTGAALLVFYVLIEKVIVTFYTREYLPVAEISKYLILAFIFHGFGDLFNRFLGAKGKGKLLRNAAYMVGIVNVLGYTLLIKYYNINGAILTKILASCLYFIVMWYYYSNFIRKHR